MSDLREQLAQSLSTATGKPVETLAGTLAHLKPSSFADEDGTIDHARVVAYAGQLQQPTAPAAAGSASRMSERRRAVAKALGPRDAVQVDEPKPRENMTMAERRELAARKFGKR